MKAALVLSLVALAQCKPIVVRGSVSSVNFQICSEKVRCHNGGRCITTNGIWGCDCSVSTAPSSGDDFCQVAPALGRKRRLVIKEVEGSSSPNSSPVTMAPATAPVATPAAGGTPSTAPLPVAPVSNQPAPGISVPVTSAPVASATTFPPTLAPTASQPSQVPTLEKAPVPPPTSLAVTSDAPSDVPSLTPSQIPSVPPVGDVPATTPTPEAPAPTTPVNNDPDDGANGVDSTSSALRVTSALPWTAAIPMALGIFLCLW